MKLFVVCFCAFVATACAAEPKPLERAHAHNDYEHTRPLLDALEHGFGNIEADVWLVDGQLLVAHNAKDVKPERTLEKLYLDPLRERVRAHGGRVYRDGPTIVLLVDVKSEAVATYAVLHDVLKSYGEMLTTFRGDKIEAKAVTVIVSGNRAPAEMAAQAIRYAAIDGRSGDLEKNPPASLVPWISENWGKLFTWKWEGAMPAADRTALKVFVDRAHTQGRKVRFWATPDRPDAWRLLREAGVDVIGTDDLAGLAKFFRESP
jgi:glycerophosphoryl diester phosphodiesterase